MATLSILLQSVSLCEDKNDMLLTPSCQAWKCPYYLYLLLDITIFSPIYDRIIVKCRMKELRAGFSFLGKVLSNVDLIEVSEEY